MLHRVRDQHAALRVQRTHALYMAREMSFVHEICNGRLQQRWRAGVHAARHPPDTLDGAQTKAVARILTSAQRMAVMVKDILDFTQTAFGVALPIVPAEADLGQVARQMVGEVATVHPDSQIQVQCDGELTGRWDAGRIGQMLSNLIANAVQHGAAQPISVVVTGSDDAVDIQVPDAPPPTWRDVGALTAQNALPAGTVVTLRVFNANGTDAERIETTLADGQTSVTAWPLRVAQNVNARSTTARIGVLGNGTISPVASATANRIFLTGTGRTHAVDIRLPDSPPPGDYDYVYPDGIGQYIPGQTVVLALANPPLAETGFELSPAGRWYRRVPREDVSELFELDLTARWNGLAVRVVDQWQDAQRYVVARVSHLGDDLQRAERLGLFRVEAGVYETVVYAAELTDLKTNQVVPATWSPGPPATPGRGSHALADRWVRA